MDIYLDTCVWNALFDQSVDPRSLMAGLAARGSGLVLSDENLFEIAKTFREGGPTVLRRGMELFSYLKQFTDASVRVTKDNLSVVAAEMTSIQLQIGIIHPYLTPDDYDTTRAMIEEHARGQLSHRTQEHVEWRIGSNESGRRGIALYIQNAPALRRALEAVSEEELPGWIQWVRSTNDGVNYLAWQIKHYFDDKPFEDIYEYAQLLQWSPANRVAMGLTARNFYFNWRYVHHNSIKKDLFLIRSISSMQTTAMCTLRKRQSSLGTHTCC